MTSRLKILKILYQNQSFYLKNPAQSPEITQEPMSHLIYELTWLYLTLDIQVTLVRVISYPCTLLLIQMTSRISQTFCNSIIH